MEKDTRAQEKDLWEIIEERRVRREEGQRDDLPPHKLIGWEGNDRRLCPHEIAGGRGWRKVD